MYPRSAWSLFIGGGFQRQHRSRPASSFRASLAEVFLHELTQLVGFFLAPVPRLFVFTSLGETPLVTARRRRPADYFRDLGPFRAQFRVLLEQSFRLLLLPLPRLRLFVHVSQNPAVNLLGVS